MTVGKALIAAAVVCFVLAAFKVDLGSVPLIPVGLAFFAGGHLVP